MTGFSVENLNVSFATAAGRHNVVRDVSFAGGQGRILGLVGESGSGKSTIGFSLPGLLSDNALVSAGRLKLGDEAFDLTNQTNLHPLRGSRVAMIFQDPFASLNPVYSVGAHLLEVIGKRAGARNIALDALRSVGMSNPERKLTQYPHELSGGLRQRVVIAMALLAQPQLIIADEPTTALDATVEAQVMSQLLLLRQKIGSSIILITHSLGLVTQYCDDIAVLYAGDIVERGTVAEVMQNPAHPYTKALLTCELSIDAPLPKPPSSSCFRVIAGELPDPFNRPEGCLFSPRCPKSIKACAASLPSLHPASKAPSHVARCIRIGEP